MTGPALLLVAHGTRDPAGAVVTERVAARARQALDVPVAVSYVDVRRPTPADALAELPGRCVAVPMFLAAGYHVRVDVPEQLRATGRGDVAVAEAFGPDPLLVDAAVQRLQEAGAGERDAVVLAVIGSSDRRAQADSALAARRLGRELGRPVTLATTAMGGPRVPDAVARLRAEGATRIAVASWLLAPGLFHRRLADCGADVVAEPLADHDAVLELIAQRYSAAQRYSGWAPARAPPEAARPRPSHRSPGPAGLTAQPDSPPRRDSRPGRPQAAALLHRWLGLQEHPLGS